MDINININNSSNKTESNSEIQYKFSDYSQDNYSLDMIPGYLGEPCTQCNEKTLIIYNPNTDPFEHDNELCWRCFIKKFDKKIEVKINGEQR